MAYYDFLSLERAGIYVQSRRLAPGQLGLLYVFDLVLLVSLRFCSFKGNVLHCFTTTSCTGIEFFCHHSRNQSPCESDKQFTGAFLQ